MNLIFKIKKIFSNNASNIHDVFFSINLIYIFIFIIVCLNKSFLINKFSKYKGVNILSFEIKYFILHLSFNF